MKRQLEFSPRAVVAHKLKDGTYLFYRINYEGELTNEIFTELGECGCWLADEEKKMEIEDFGDGRNSIWRVN